MILEDEVGWTGRCFGVSASDLLLIEPGNGFVYTSLQMASLISRKNQTSGSVRVLLDDIVFLVFSTRL